MGDSDPQYTARLATTVRRIFIINIFKPNKKLKAMKKILAVMMVAAAMTACTSDNDLTEGMTQQTTPERQDETVTLSFQPYTMEAMTRAGQTGIGSVVSRLDVWVFEGDSAAALLQDTAAVEVHQRKGSGFGSLTLTLDKARTYTLYAIGHKGSAPLAMEHGTVALPEGKKLQTLYFQTTFKPADVRTLTCEMRRAVGLFYLNITDEIPDTVARIAITTGNAATEWSFPEQRGLVPQEYGVEWTQWTGKSDGVAFSMYVVGSDEPVEHDITVTAYAADSTVVKEHTFTAVPLRNGYRTTYRGRLFKDVSFAPTFTVDDWNEYDPVAF